MSLLDTFKCLRKGRGMTPKYCITCQVEQKDIDCRRCPQGEDIASQYPNRTKGEMLKYPGTRYMQPKPDEDRNRDEDPYIPTGDPTCRRSARGGRC